MVTIEHKKERVFKTSPFLYHKNMSILVFNEKTNVTYEEIQKFILKKLLTTVDMSILDALYQFEFLNKYLIEQYLNQILPTRQQKQDYKKNLKKMTAQGVIIRYAFRYNEETEQKQSPYFYGLSPGAFAYIRKFGRKDASGKKYTIPELNATLRRLSLNQFYINFQKDYRHLVKRTLLYHDITLKEQVYHIPLSLRLRIKAFKKKYMDISIVTIRRNVNWEKNLLIDLHNIQAVSEQHIFDKNCIIIVAEDILQIKECFILLQKQELQDCTFLFTTDVQVAREPVLDYLYECYYEKKNIVDKHSNQFEPGSPLRDTNNMKQVSPELSNVSMLVQKISTT